MKYEGTLKQSIRWGKRLAKKKGCPFISHTDPLPPSINKVEEVLVCLEK